MKIKLPKNNGILIHGGGWKKLENISVSKKKFKNRNRPKSFKFKKHRRIRD